MDKNVSTRASLSQSESARSSSTVPDPSGASVHAAGPALPAVEGAAATATAPARTLADLDKRLIARVGDLGEMGAHVPLPPEPREFRISVRRPEDLLVFDLVFAGLTLQPNPPRLARTSRDAYIVVEFPPQSFGEEAYLEAGGDEEFDPVPDEKIEVSSHPSYPPKNNAKQLEDAMPRSLPAARVRMSGRSRIAIDMPATESEVSYDLNSMLRALRTWPMRLDFNAVADPSRNELGVEWLKDVMSLSAWGALRARVTDALAESAGPASGRLLAAVQDAAGRLAQRAAVGISRPRQGLEAPRRVAASTAEPLAALPEVAEDLHTVLLQDMVGEVARLQEQFPGLREPSLRAVGMAALSLSATEALANPALEIPAGQALAPHIPFLPFLFGPHEPGHGVTALELPYRLFLTPLLPARWRHRDAPVTHADRTELWHTRLTTAVQDTGPDEASRIRALWSPDYRSADDFAQLIALLSNPLLIRMSLDPVDRAMLVTLMAGFDATRDTRATPYRPISSEAKRLHLSALGGLLEAEGDWPKNRPGHVDLTQWRHLATLGRDHYVRVVYAGFLCPFGHAASLVKVTERKFQSLQADRTRRVAILRQRFFIVVREPVRFYDGSNHRFHCHNFPFKEVEILTRVTPDLAQPGAGASGLDAAFYGPLARRMLFWPMVPGSTSGQLIDVPFEIAVTGLKGQRGTFTLPLLFISDVAENLAFPPNEDMSKHIKDAYNATAPSTRRRALLGGQTVTFAPYADGDAGDPRLPTESITFRAGDRLRRAKPNFHPEIDVAVVGIKPIQKLLSQPNFVTEVTYPDVYKEDQFAAATNAGMIFLQLTSAQPLNFGGDPGQAKSDALGALASPQMALLGLSKLSGPVGGDKTAASAAQVKNALNDVFGGQFDPSKFFDQAKILGGVNLGDVIKAATSLDAPEVPKFLTQDVPDGLEASFTWTTEVTKSDPLNLLIPSGDSIGKTPLTMDGRVTRPFDPSKPTTFVANATIENFKVNLFGFIILWFDRLSFQARSGQKPDVSLQLHPNGAVRFGGPLEFVNSLRDYIPSNGFSDPPSLAVTPSGINASFSLTLPAIEVGIFALANASLGAAFNLPFDSRPASVKFNFSERDRPFSLTVSLLGGGGFFALGVSTRGVNEIEAALEFGAAISIDLGVASGGVEVKAGIYFHWLEPMPNKGSVDLAGYVRIHGELSVLAIISVSLTFHLQLGYHKEPGRSVVYGEATLTVEIDILMFSAEVSVTCRREFGGAAADPRLIEHIPTEDVWSEYCSAFAEEKP